MSELTNRVALVTGGSRGIGRAVALALSGAGATVALNYLEREKDAATVVRAIQEQGGRAEAFKCDVSQGASVRSMVQAIQECLGPIDILVNNAGLAAAHEIAVTEEEFDRIIAVNLKSAFLCTEAVISHMRTQRWGRIVNISAMGARAGSGSVAYGASKAGLEGMTRSYALQLAAENVTSVAVAPGLVDTEMARPLIEAGLAKVRVPMGRAGTVKEIAHAVMFAVLNSYLSGQTISINGGAFFS